ncbi:hypothetical protein E3N88_44981 [Mikania micrantha]|uniref:Beta-amylase n=1 Tax=Mikania micrantha TaxID=192012 RepID=A0A5N6LAH4_9ASTR|nr:hypothetical protein E3N88_44981 [Mikania micrantha]
MFLTTQRGFCQSGSNNNKPMMIICATENKLHMGFSQMLKSSNFPVKVSSRYQSAASTKASRDPTISDHVSVELPIWWGVSEREAMGKYEWSGYLALVDMIQKSDGGSWETAYGDFFLSWYSTQLVSHADRMLSLASSSFNDTTVKVTGKLPLVPSWYRSRSHPAEVTAGFYNTIYRNGYEEIAKIFCKNSCGMILPGVDMLDEQQPNEVFSSPELLLADIRDACRNHGVEVCGQNLNVASTIKNFEQIKQNLVGENGIELFLYQRMGSDFFSPENFPLFTAFVRSLNQVEVDLDDLGVNDGESVLLVPGKIRKLQAV